MAIFTLTENSSSYEVNRSSVDTECSSSFNYSIEAPSGDLIDVVLTGDFEGAYYIDYNVRIEFNGTLSSFPFNRIMSVGFFLKNSGTSGVFNKATVVINNTSDGSEAYTDLAIRNNDDVDCDYQGLTADPTPEANQVAVFSGDNSIAGSNDLTFDGAVLATTGDMASTRFIKTGGLSTEYLMANGSVSTIDGGEAGGDLNYIHDQGVSSALWTIAHLLDKRPSVSVIDSAGNVVIGEVTHTDSNNLTIEFNAGFSGQAYIN